MKKKYHKKTQIINIHLSSSNNFYAMHKFILLDMKWLQQTYKKQSIQKVVHITISSQLLMLYSSGLEYNISKYQTYFPIHPVPFKIFIEKSLLLKNPQFSTPCTLQVVLTTIKNIRDISDRFINIVWNLNATWLYIFHPSLSLYIDQCDRTLTTDIKENMSFFNLSRFIAPSNPQPCNSSPLWHYCIWTIVTGLAVLDIKE